MVENPSPISLMLNREQAALLLKGLKALPDTDRQAVTFQSLQKDLETITVIWDHSIKNQKMLQEQRRAQKLQQKNPVKT